MKAKKPFYMSSKRSWIRIAEAFIAIILIMGVVLIIVARQRIETSREEEIIKLQRNILDYVSKDEVLRAQILANNSNGTYEKIKSIVPEWLNYSVRICSYEDICALGFYVPKNVYANEILIVANLTYYVPENATKLKLFFWEK